MPLTDRLAEYIRACFAGIWIQSHEHGDALLEIARLCLEEHWKVVTWDIDRGLNIAGRDVEEFSDPASAYPLAAVHTLSAMDSGDGASLLILVNFHRFLNSAEIVQAVAHQIQLGKTRRTFLIVLSPVVEIPSELKSTLCVSSTICRIGRSLKKLHAASQPKKVNFPTKMGLALCSTQRRDSPATKQKRPLV